MFHSEYDPTTGLLTGRYHFCSKANYSPPVREGMAWIEGKHDHATQRVDLATGEVVPR